MASRLELAPCQTRLTRTYSSVVPNQYEEPTNGPPIRWSAFMGRLRNAAVATTHHERRGRGLENWERELGLAQSVPPCRSRTAIGSIRTILYRTKPSREGGRGVYDFCRCNSALGSACLEPT